MLVWRICKKKHARTAFSGVGSDTVGGRWNPKGYRCVYTSEHPAVAAMETFVHLDPAFMPPMVLICAELNIAEFEYLTPEDLPSNWKSNPAPESLQKLGKDWLDRCESIALEVPSVAAPAGKNILLNPAHPDIKKLSVISTEPFHFDSRMFDR